MRLSVAAAHVDPERETMLEVVRETYERLTAPGRPDACELEFLTPGEDSWGRSMNRAAREASGELILLASDDMLPHEGFLAAALPVLEAGLTPVSRCSDTAGAPLNTGFDLAAAGTYQSWTRLFLLTPERFRVVGPLIETTWFTDFDYSERLNSAGYQLVACPGFAFTHLDGPRSWATADELERQQQLYDELRAAREAV